VAGVTEFQIEEAIRGFRAEKEQRPDLQIQEQLERLPRGLVAFAALVDVRGIHVTEG